MRSFTLGKSRHNGVKYQQNGADRRIELFVCDVRVSFRFDGLAVVNVAQRAFHLLISALNITMSQRKSLLYVSNITSTVSGVRLEKLLPISLKFYRLFQGERDDRSTELVIVLITLASFDSGLSCFGNW
jgi:hypothetical protein